MKLSKNSPRTPMNTKRKRKTKFFNNGEPTKPKSWFARIERFDPKTGDPVWVKV